MNLLLIMQLTPVQVQKYKDNHLLLSSSIWNNSFLIQLLKQRTSDHEQIPQQVQQLLDKTSPKQAICTSQSELFLWVYLKEAPPPAVVKLPEQALSFSGDSKQHLPTWIEIRYRKRKIISFQSIYALKANWSLPKYCSIKYLLTSYTLHLKKT